MCKINIFYFVVFLINPLHSQVFEHRSLKEGNQNLTHEKRKKKIDLNKQIYHGFFAKIIIFRGRLAKILSWLESRQDHGKLYMALIAG